MDNLVITLIVLGVGLASGSFLTYACCWANRKKEQAEREWWAKRDGWIERM